MLESEVRGRVSDRARVELRPHLVVGVVAAVMRVVVAVQLPTAVASVKEVNLGGHVAFLFLGRSVSHRRQVACARVHRHCQLSRVLVVREATLHRLVHLLSMFHGCCILHGSVLKRREHRGVPVLVTALLCSCHGLIAASHQLTDYLADLLALLVRVQTGGGPVSLGWLF